MYGASIEFIAMTIFFFVAPTIGILLLLRLVYLLGQVLGVLSVIHEVLEDDEMDHDDIMLGEYSDEEEEDDD